MYFIYCGLMFTCKNVYTVKSLVKIFCYMLVAVTTLGALSLIMHFVFSLSPWETQTMQLNVMWNIVKKQLWCYVSFMLFLFYFAHYCCLSVASLRSCAFRLLLTLQNEKSIVRRIQIIWNVTPPHSDRNSVVRHFSENIACAVQGIWMTTDCLFFLFMTGS